MVHISVQAHTDGKDHKDTDKFITDYGVDLKAVAVHVLSSDEKSTPLLNESVEYPVVIDDDDLVDKKDIQDETDPWDMPSFKDDSIPWSDLTASGKVKRVVLGWIGKALCLVALLYLFICSLDLLSSAFRLLGGKAAGQAFSSNALLQNPVCGLMIGILATVLVQSSSTSTSIVITMVASGILKVENAIFIIMGANIGTSVTNTIVSMAQSGDRNQFRRAFAGATVHDMFNWLSVAVLLPLEVATGYLYKLTLLMVKSMGLKQASGAKCDFLKKLTKPLTENIIKLDKSVIEGIALGRSEDMEKSLVKRWCVYNKEIQEQNVTVTGNFSSESNYTYELQNVTVKIPVEECSFLFHNTGIRDSIIGFILLGVSLLLLCTCLVLLVKILNSVLKGKIAKLVKKTINADFPGKCSYFTGYAAILMGAGMTVLVQSSSVFTSAMTPLVGVGVIKLERMYPLTLGSNIGTTGTGMLAAMAASGDKLHHSVQIALVHLFFNISGILLFYPIPQLRFPIGLAKMMGNTTAKYRWFAILYLIVMFFIIPGCVFTLSMAGTITFAVVFGLVLLVLAFVIALNILQRKAKKILPDCLKTWDFLPCKWMHSLEPLDRLFTKILSIVKQNCCFFKRSSKKSFDEEGEGRELNEIVVDDSINSGSSQSVQNSSLFDTTTESETQEIQSEHNENQASNHSNKSDNVQICNLQKNENTNTERIGADVDNESKAEILSSDLTLRNNTRNLSGNNPVNSQNLDSEQPDSLLSNAYIINKNVLKSQNNSPDESQSNSPGDSKDNSPKDSPRHSTYICEDSNNNSHT